MMKFILISTISLISLTSYSSETKTFESKTIKKVEVDNMSGTTKITGSDQEQTTVSYEKVRFGDQCEMKIAQRGSTLYVEVTKNKLAIGVECKANITMQIPKAAQLEVESGSGHVEVSDVTRSLQYKVGSGDVKINAALENLNGKSGSGYISLKGSVIDADIKAGSGEFNLTYTSPPQPGEINIKTGSSSATIQLPAATDVAVSTMTASGSTQNEFAINKNAKFKISFKSGSGNLVVKKIVEGSAN